LSTDPSVSETSGALRLRSAYRFFLPLIFMTELNMISKSVVHAFLARMTQAETALAGFNVSFTFYYSVTSATEVSALLTLSYAKDRQSLLQLLKFFCLLIALPWTLTLCVAFTELGTWLYRDLFGASDEAVRQAKLATFVFSLSAPVLVLRAFSFGLLMLSQRTIFITYATFFRLASLGASLIVIPWYIDGAAAGAAALVFCMFVETCVSWLFAWPEFRRLPRHAEGWSVPKFRELWRFAWPLMLNSSSEMGMVFAINIALGRLASPDLALAAFGVVHGLVSLLMSPLRNLVHTAQTLIHSSQDFRVLVRFTAQLSVIFSVLGAVLFLTPLEHWVLHDIMGLEPRLEDYVSTGMQMAFLMAGVWGFSALFRGVLAGRRSTTMLATTGLARVSAAAGVAALGLSLGAVNGAILGLIAWLSGYASEAALLYRKLRRAHQLFDREP
jgi:O-antigen/teichoic acid export membrane protein